MEQFINEIWKPIKENPVYLVSQINIYKSRYSPDHKHYKMVVKTIVVRES